MEVRVKNKIAFATTGGRSLNSAKQTVILIHGAGMDHTVWVLQTRYFAHHGYNVLAIDLPAHGRSQGPACETITDMADWVIELLDSLSISRVSMVGHSMGSLVALDLASRYPGRVEVLVMMGVAVPMVVSEKLLATAKKNDHGAIDLITMWGHARCARIGGNQSPGLWMNAMSERLLERASVGVLYRDLKACSEYHDGLEAASKFCNPAFLILGSEDRMTPLSAAKSLANSLANAKQYVVEGCGHLMMVEKPDEVLELLRKVL